MLRNKRDYMDLNCSYKGLCYMKNFFTIRLTNHEHLVNQHPWENLNIKDIYLSEMVSVPADRGNS